MCCEEAAIFSQPLHLSPILEKNHSTFPLPHLKLKLINKVLVQSFLMSLMPPKRGPWVKNWEFGFDFFSFVKIPTKHQDLWEISAN